MKIQLGLAALLIAVWIPRAYGGPGLPGEFCRDLQNPFFHARTVRADGVSVMAPARRWTHTEEFLMPKPSGTFRVIIVGESVAYLLDGKALRRVLGAYIPAAKTIEVINAGVPSYDSSMIASVAEEIAAYQPDLMVVLSGNNETNTGEECPGMQKSVADRLLVLNLPGAARLKQGLALLDPYFFTKRPGRLLLFEGNLRRMVRAVRSKGAAVILCALPVNAADYAPWGAANFENPLFADAWSNFERGAWPQAAKLFRPYIAQFPQEPLGHYFLGICLRQMGRFDEAREQFLEAVEWDPVGDRATPTKNGIIRKVAVEEGAYLAELDRAFTRASPDGLVGYAQILDGVHWATPQLNALASYEILRAISDSPIILRKPGAFDRPRFEKKYEEVLAAGRAASEARVSDMTSILCAFAYFDRWGRENKEGAILENGVALLRYAYSGGNGIRKFMNNFTLGALSLMRSISPWAPDIVAHYPQWYPVYLEHMGEMHRRQGESRKSLAYFDGAIRLDPDRHLTRVFRAKARASIGDEPGAQSDVDALRSRLPEGSRWPAFAARAVSEK